MLGAIIGDIIGSVYEHNNIKTKEFQLYSPNVHFTDDSVLTIALADSILNNNDYGQIMRQYYTRYPNAGYGQSFHKWALTPNSKAYDSWGNGAAMRTSPVGYAFDNIDEVLLKAKYYASFTHNHPEGIKGAQATSVAVFMAKNGASKKEIKDYIINKFQYDLSKTVDEIRPDYKFDISCQGTVPQAIISFCESVSYEDAIRNAISIGGDSDTLACITGGIAEAFYKKIPDKIKKPAINILDENLQAVVTKFYQKFMTQLELI